MAGIRAGNLSEGLPQTAIPDEILQTLVEGGGTQIERIVSTGQVTPEGTWYEQEWDEFVLLVAGSARLQIEGEAEERKLGPGDWVLLPAHCRHRVSYTRADPPTVWLAVHF